MSELVDPEQCEDIVGARRHEYLHLITFDSQDQIAYILHSETCRETNADLRDCPFSLALDEWKVGQPPFPEDEPVFVVLERGRLTPWLATWNPPV